jgi:hypothetical protein
MRDCEDKGAKISGHKFRAQKAGYKLVAPFAALREAVCRCDFASLCGVCSRADWVAVPRQLGEAPPNQIASLLILVWRREEEHAAPVRERAAGPAHLTWICDLKSPRPLLRVSRKFSGLFAKTRG